MPDIYYFTPYHPDGLGVAYNRHCALVPNDDDWIVIMDSDIMFFSSQRFGDQLADAISNHPEYQVLTCVTNRMTPHCEQQVRGGNIRMERDLVKLKKEADAVYRNHKGKINPVRGFFAGYFMAFPKRVWKEFPFPEVGSQGGKILGIDSEWCHRIHRANVKVGLLLGLMAVHFYRLDKGEGDLSHLGDPGHNPRAHNVWDPRSRGTVPGPADPRNKPPLRIKLNPNLRPPGGFTFREADGMEIRSDTAEKLVKLVEDYRKRQNKPPGNPLKEFTEQVYAKHPNFCLRY